MDARSNIVRWGSTLAIRIPKRVAEQWGVCEGSRIDMESRGDQLVMSKRAYDLTEMLTRMSPETLHGEIDTGPCPRERGVVEDPHPPDTGDIVWLAFTPHAGSPAGRVPRAYGQRSSLWMSQTLRALLQVVGLVRRSL